MNTPVILIVERDDTQRRNLQNLLLCDGFQVIEASDTAEIFRSFHQTRHLALLIVTASLDASDDGLKIVQQFRQWDRTLPVIVIARHSSEELAIAALKAGVADYFRPPFSSADLLESVRRCIANHLPARPSGHSAAPIRSAGRTPESGVMHVIGEGPAMQEIKASMARVAATDSTVLITGETGTGKELVANYIHSHSRRQQKPFVEINCAAIPDGLLESELFGYERGAFTGASSAYEGKLKLANGGTIFFDEIGDMTPYAQAKLLRAVESREVQRLGVKKGLPVDVRVVAATNQDLAQLMAEGRFRKDLYYRLNVARIHLPPLRERPEDLPLLFIHYIGECNRQFGHAVEGFTDEALDSLLRYDWPGNVRELKNMIEAIFVQCPGLRISVRDLPEPFRTRGTEADQLPADERAQMLAALLSTNWNKSKAADKLHWSRVTLYRKMWKYHIVSKGEANNNL